MKINSSEEAQHEAFPNDSKFRIDFKSINTRIDFFNALKETNKAIYNWGWDRLTSNGIDISGEEFIEIANVCAITSADVVFVLRWNDIEVTIEVDYTSKWSSFKNEKELSEFLEKIDVDVMKIKKS